MPDEAKLRSGIQENRVACGFRISAADSIMTEQVISPTVDSSTTR
jgi:hypothetical protein